MPIEICRAYQIFTIKYKLLNQPSTRHLSALVDNYSARRFSLAVSVTK